MIRLKNKIRVMHLIHQLGAGGAENGIINLANHINKDVFNISVCVFTGKGSRISHLTELSDLFSMNKKNGNDLTLPLRLAGLFREWKPHIVHTHAWGTLVEGLTGAKLAGVPVLIHGEHGTMQIKLINKYVQKFMWKFCDQILSVSLEHKKRLSETIGFSQNKIKVVPNGVDSKFFAPKNENRLQKKGSFTIGTIGRLVPVKNHVFLIKAIKEISETYSNVELVIAGDGPLRNDLMAFADSIGISSKICFLGKRFDISDILNSFDVFVLPSISEGMSNTILEAMSCGLPVVATDVGGNSELITNSETGILIELNNLKQLAQSLISLIRNPEIRKKYGEKARKRIEENFTLKKMISNYENLYIDLYKMKNKFSL